MLIKLSSLSIYKNVVIKAGLQGKYREFLGGSLNWAFCEYSQSSEPWQDSAALLFPWAMLRLLLVSSVSVLVMLFKHQGLGLIKPLPGVTREIYRPQLDWRGLALLGVSHPKPALPAQPRKDWRQPGAEQGMGLGAAPSPSCSAAFPAAVAEQSRLVSNTTRHSHLDFWGKTSACSALGAAGLVPSGFVGCHCQKPEVKVAVMLDKNAMASPG